MRDKEKVTNVRLKTRETRERVIEREKKKEREREGKAREEG